MENFVAAIIVVMSLTVATFQVIRNYRYKELTERRHWLLAIVLYADSWLVIWDLLASGSGLEIRLLVDVMLALIPLMLLSSSVWPVSRCINTVRLFVAAMAMLSLFHILCIFSLSSPPGIEIYIYASAALTVLFVLLFLWGYSGVDAFGSMGRVITSFSYYRGCRGIGGVPQSQSRREGALFGTCDTSSLLVPP
jgi:hypothetical protein